LGWGRATWAEGESGTKGGGGARAGNIYYIVTKLKIAEGKGQEKD
jgi:hypothetical protein